MTQFVILSMLLVASGSGGHLLPSSSQFTFTFTFTYKVNLRDMKYNLNLMQNLENIAVLRLGFALQLRITIWKEHPQPSHSTTWNRQNGSCSIWNDKSLNMRDFLLNITTHKRASEPRPSHQATSQHSSGYFPHIQAECISTFNAGIMLLQKN